MIFLISCKLCGQHYLPCISWRHFQLNNKEHFIQHWSHFHQQLQPSDHLTALVEIRDVHPEQLHPVQPIELSLLDPYYAQSLLPHSAFLSWRQSDVHPGVSSTAAYQVEASSAAAPSLQPSTHSGSLNTSWTTFSATSPHTTYSGAPLQGKHST